MGGWPGVKSLRIGDFTEDEVYGLYRQHTAETGQQFTEPAVERAFGYTQGQPWLVNALAWEVIQEMGVAPPEPITADHIDQAKERLIAARATHLDSLAAKLQESRVHRVIEPLIAGDLPDLDQTFNDDLAYTRDLGLVAQGWPARVANPIYQEVIVRVLGDPVEAGILAEPRSFVQDDGRLNFRWLLAEFADFWREHGDVLGRRQKYHEVAPQLVIMAFLHRIVNGGGYISREYGAGRDRIDLEVRWPYPDARNNRQWQREAVELKVWHPNRSDPLSAGLRQLDRYLDKLGLDHGTLVIFDRRPADPPPYASTSFGQERTPSGRTVTLLRG